MQDFWLQELRRVLKPDGILFFTVHGHNAAQILREKDDKRVLQTQGFLHKKSRKLAGLTPDWYHTTFHSERYIRDKVRPYFGESLYLTIPEGMQDCVVTGAIHAHVAPQNKKIQLEC